MTQALNIRIVSAASRNELGEVISSPRHYDLFFHSIVRTLPKEKQDLWYVKSSTVEQGFIDQFGNFLSRNEAWKIAEANGQIIRDHDKCPGKLFSEHIY